VKIKVRQAEFVISAATSAQFPADDEPEIAFAGRSNVGKSSLINTLANRKGLAITSSTPGRTRLVNFFDLFLDPGPGHLRFVDLPGYGFAKAPKGEREEWKKRVELYVTKRVSLRAIVHLVDIRHEPSPLDFELMRWVSALGRDEIVVFTKADKLGSNAKRNQAAKLEKAMGLEPKSAVVFSSHTGEGRDELWTNIVKTL